MNNKPEINKYNEIIEKLQKKSYRLTSIRQKIIFLLIANKNKHIGINDIIESLKVDNININIMSVYNTIDLLLKEDVIDAKIAVNKQVFYELSDDIIHLICSVCQSVTHMTKSDINDANVLNLTAISTIFAKSTTFKFHHFNLEIHGLCLNCQ